MNDGPRISRRALVTGALAGLAGCDTSHPQRGLLGAMERFTRGAEELLYRPSVRARTPGRADETPLAQWPAYFVSPSVPVAPAGWRLMVGGMVARPAMLDLDDLRRMTRTDLRVEHHCVEGWSAVASWHGVRLVDIAARVGADVRAGFVEFRSFDAGYHSSWDRASALHPQTLVAYGMEGAPLTPAHGAPLRLYSATKLGYKNVKYLSEINFVPHATGGYWEDLGYEWYGGV